MEAFEIILNMFGLFALGALSGNGLFTRFKQELMNGNIDLVNDDIRVSGINSTGQAALTDTTSNFISEVAAGNRTHAAGSGATQGVALSGKAVSGATFSANNLTGTFTDPNNGNGATTCILVHKWDGVAESSSVLIAYDVLASGVNQDGTNDDLTFTGGDVFDL